MNILRPIQKDFYGDDHRWFLGTVVNSSPPAGLEGRVKIRIRGVHSGSTDDIPERDLPWAQVLVPSTEGGSSGIGRISQLQAGAFVFGIFLDGVSSQTPLVLGSLPHIEYPTDVQSSKPQQGENDFNYRQERIQNVVALDFKDDSLDTTSTQLRRNQATKFFIDNGYNIIHACALTGAIEAKSGFRTFNNSEAAQIGILRWEYSTFVGSRYSELLRFAQQFQPASDWRLYSIQIQFVLFELANRFNQARRKLTETTNLKDACEVLRKFYVKSNTDFTSYARRAYDEVLS